MLNQNLVSHIVSNRVLAISKPCDLWKVIPFKFQFPHLKIRIIGSL